MQPGWALGLGRPGTGVRFRLRLASQGSAAKEPNSGRTGPEQTDTGLRGIQRGTAFRGSGVAPRSGWMEDSIIDHFRIEIAGFLEGFSIQVRIV